MPEIGRRGAGDLEEEVQGIGSPVRIDSFIQESFVPSSQVGRSLSSRNPTEAIGTDTKECYCQV